MVHHASWHGHKKPFGISNQFTASPGLELPVLPEKLEEQLRYFCDRYTAIPRETRPSASHAAPTNTIEELARPTKRRIEEAKAAAE